MTLSSSREFLSNRRTLWVVSGVSLLLFLITNLPWQLDDYDQGLQALTSLEMIKEGHWFYQRTPHELIAQKPPLIGWASAGVFAVTRSWDAAWRLPSLLSAVAMAIVLFRAATAAYGTMAGLLALSAFSLNLLSVRLATLVRTDMPLGFVIFLLGLLIWQKIREGQPWEARDRLVLFLLLTGSMLIKGPIVYAFLLPGIVVFEWRWRKEKIVHAWCGWWPWLASLAVFLVWVIGGILTVPGFYDHVVVREFLGRFSETIHRPQPVYYYLPHLLHKFAPWSILMIAIAVLSVRRSRLGMREALRQTSPDMFWLLCWSLGGVILMSVVPSKRVDRIFPVIPPLCLLLGAQVARSLTNERLRHQVSQWSAAALFFAFFFTGGYTLWKVVPGYRDHRDALARFGRAVRNECLAHHWRYEAISPSVGGNGMLPYLEKTHFIEPDEAKKEWNSGAVDALVVPTADAPRLKREVQNAPLSPLRSGKRKSERGKGYTLLTRADATRFPAP
jgi:4-amino-4-deoxy-L-arabinose transferase-like glycosyltransferase